MKEKIKKIITKEVAINLIIALVAAVVGAGLDHYLALMRDRKDYEKMDKYELLYEAYLCYEKQDYLECINIYNIEKLQDHPEALNNLGFLYENGIGVAKDSDKARELFAKAYEYDNNYTSGIAAISVLEPRDMEETRKSIVNSLKNEDIWTTYFIDTLMKEEFSLDEKDSRDFYNLSVEEQKNVLEADLQKEYEWKRDNVKDNYFCELMPVEYEQKERIGSYESEGKRKPLYGTVTYKLYRKRSFKYSEMIRNGIEFRHDFHKD